MSSLSSISGTKLSQHTHTSSPTGTKLSQHTQNCPFQPVLPEQGELCPARTTTTPSRENFVPHQAPNPVQNSPHTPTKAHFSPFYPSRENFLPHPEPNPVQNSPNTPPASSPPGTKLSQHAQKGPFQPVLPEQGELCTALTPTPPSRENFVPRPAPNPVQNSPCSAGPSAQPVQNSPNTPKKAHFSPFCTSRENFLPHPAPRPPAGRTLYRAQCQTRYKTLPAPPFYSGSAKKFAQYTLHHNRTAEKFVQHT